MAVTEVAYLGPIGTYSHLVAEKRYGRNCKMIALPTILDVCSFASGKTSRHGIVPIENSSGGAIYETVDILLANKPKVHIKEELSLDVKLALLGRGGRENQGSLLSFRPARTLRRVAEAAPSESRTSCCNQHGGSGTAGIKGTERRGAREQEAGTHI